MQTINIVQLKTALRTAIVPGRMPLMIWGPPGVGKSEAIAQSAAEHDAELVDIRLSQYDSVDLRGIPVAGEDMLTTWHAPSTLPFKSNPRFSDDKLIFLFLDEINSAAPSVAAVAYQLINDRRVGEHELRDNVVIVAAGNREGDKGVTNRMPTPLANRFIHVEVTADVDSFCLWASETGAIPAIGIAFLQFRKPLLSQFDEALKSGKKAFATPRTWQKAFSIYANPSIPADTKNHLMAGSVGDGPANEFWGFAEVWSKMTPISEIIKNPDTVKMPDEAAMRYATAVAVSGTLDKETVTPLATFLNRMDPEFAILAWRMAGVRDKTLITTREFAEMAKKHKNLFAPV